MNKSILKNFIIITLIFVFSLIIVVVLSDVFTVLKYKDVEFYEIDEDKIPSINVVSKNNKLYSYKVEEKTRTITKIFKYKNVKDVKSDLNNYIDILKNDYNFIYTSDIDLSLDKGSIELSTNSVSKNCIIIVNIEYDKDSYIINVAKGNGVLNILNN